VCARVYDNLKHVCIRDVVLMRHLGFQTHSECNYKFIKAGNECWLANKPAAESITVHSQLWLRTHGRTDVHGNKSKEISIHGLEQLLILNPAYTSLDDQI
jgi:hypothetical protein